MPEADKIEQTAHTRVCTDVCCALIFYAWLGGMGAIQYYAVQNGNLDKLTHGFNWQNEICGVTERVRDRPYLFWCPPADGSMTAWNLADGICLPSCPQGENELCPGQSSQFHLNISDGQGNFIITSGVNRTTTLRATYASTRAAFFCVPDASVESGAALAKGFAGAMAGTSSITAVVEGIRDSGAFFGGVAVFAILLGYGFLYLLGKFVGILIQILVFIVGIGLMLLGGGFLTLGYCASTPSARCDPRMEGMLDDYISRDNIPMVGYGIGGVLSVIFLVYFVMMCCMRSQIHTIIDALHDATNIIKTMPTLVLLPIIQAILKLSVLSGLVFGLCWVVSLGEPSPVVISEAGVNVQGVGRHFTFTDNQFYALCFFSFGCLWLVETISAVGQYVISHVVVSESVNHAHFSMPLFRGYWNCFKYHIGTVAFGGFVLGVLRFVSAILAVFMKAAKDKEGKQNMCVRICCCCCMCCMECLTDAVELLNELVYTDVAITGVGYMTAAKNVIAMAATNPATYGGVKLATEVLGFLGTFGLTFIGTYIPYQILANPSLFGADQVVQAMNQQSQMGCTVVSFLISFFISMAFMSSFNQVALALMYIKLHQQQEKEQEENYSKMEDEPTK